MRTTRPIVEWHGERFTVQPLKGNSPVQPLPLVWAISRRGEFIGTLPYRQEETTKEFEIRCTAWLQSLLGTPPPRDRPTSDQN